MRGRVTVSPSVRVSVNVLGRGVKVREGAGEGEDKGVWMGMRVRKDVAMFGGGSHTDSLNLK